VYLQQGIISLYAAIIESFQMKKHRQSLLIRSFPQRFNSIWQPASRLPKIENTYPQLM